MFRLLIASVVICDLYLFHIISLLNPDFKLVNNLLSSSLDKVTAGTYNLQSFICNLLEHYLYYLLQCIFALN